MENGVSETQLLARVRVSAGGVDLLIKLGGRQGHVCVNMWVDLWVGYSRKQLAARPQTPRGSSYVGATAKLVPTSPPHHPST